ncbi:hypothetical protein C8R44DRAFT_976014 [Mycena epipterygia]|nr:hypothetical protein C8R44DRAFT_976014 [Mycena epipterygia]
MSAHELHVPTSFDNHLDDLMIGLASAGLALTAIVLLAFAYTAWNRTSRRHLNRVSFRLLVYAMYTASSMMFAGSLLPIPAITGPSGACTFAAFAGNITLMFSACMFCSMALNLQLVLVHGVDGRMMEKYYLIGSFVLCTVCNITPLAAGQYGFFAVNTTCWFTNPDTAMLVRWLVGTQTFWILLMSTVEVACFAVLVAFMARHRTLLKCAVESAVEMKCPSVPAISTVASSVQYRNMIVRIGMYPLMSCCLSFSGCLLDLYVAKHTTTTELAFRVNVLDICIYATRALIYASLAAFDPSFLRALRALRSQTSTKTSTQYANSRRPKRFSYGTKALGRVQLEQISSVPEEQPSEETCGPLVDTRRDKELQYKLQRLDEENADAGQGMSDQLGERTRRLSRRILSHDIASQL